MIEISGGLNLNTFINLKLEDDEDDEDDEDEIDVGSMRLMMRI
jgi:hypothetical protein